MRQKSARGVRNSSLTRSRTFSLRCHGICQEIKPLQLHSSGYCEILTAVSGFSVEEAAAGELVEKGVKSPRKG